MHDAHPSPSATLRRAAALMRERAEAAERAHESPWKPLGAGTVVHQRTKRITGPVAETYPLSGGPRQVATTKHITSWHPRVGIAVADLLDDEARLCEETGSRPYDYTLAVALAYLGESA